MKHEFLLASAVALLSAAAARAGEITSVPSAMNQGGMIMPVLSITGADNLTNPTTGTVSLTFGAHATPQLADLQRWSPGNWFSASAPWRAGLGSAEGAGGTPAASAGAGDLFNSQYGFTFSTVVLGVTNAAVPAGKSLGIKLVSYSSPDMASFNYRNSGGVTLWDAVLSAPGDQVLWNGSMWHNYFTMPADALPGSYTARFEVFVADHAFDTNAGTGAANYGAAALAAAADTNFTPATVDYAWTVVPEPPASALLAAGALALAWGARRRSRRRAVKTPTALALLLAGPALHAAMITSLPGPDDQGGMLMPQVYIAGADDYYEPTKGALAVSFAASEIPVMGGVQYWSPGSWFDPAAAWCADLGSPAGSGGTPPSSAGAARLFNCQYGWTFFADPALRAAFVPTGKSLAIRLVATSSPDLRVFNYDDYANIWDEVLGSTSRTQVLWDGSMWHSYATLRAKATPGVYSATYEVFVADEPFAGDTGFADYSPLAQTAPADTNFAPARITFSWVVPGTEPPPSAAIRISGGAPTVSVPSAPGRSYRLQFRGGVTGAWTNAATPVAGTGFAVDLRDETSPRPNARYYRVVESR